MKKEDIDHLLEKYYNGQCTPEELAFLISWYNDLEQQLPDPQTIPDFEQVQKDAWARLMVQHLDATRPQRMPRVRLYWKIAAAFILLITTSVIYFYQHNKPQPKDLYTLNKLNDIQPGTSKAILTLGSGKQIGLNEKVYRVSPSGASGTEESQYNTITTPKGGQYELILPDGTHVYLNAASSLKYPVKFNGHDRKVTLSGEAYFEVAKNKEVPFIVDASSQRIKVLGTHFNIAAYPDDNVIRTTLAEGKVLVSNQKDSLVLNPSQQVIGTVNSLRIEDVNLDDVLGWKDGLFIFENISLKEMLRQISRWYDVEVDLNNIPEANFDGTVRRDYPLSELLRIIEKTNHIKFKIEGRTITIIR